jgi:hypothetical protein
MRDRWPNFSVERNGWPSTVLPIRELWWGQPSLTFSFAVSKLLTKLSGKRNFSCGSVLSSYMNKKALFVGAIFLTVAITIIILHNRAAIRTLPGSQQIAQTHTAAATAGPKEEAESAQVTLTGIMTIPGRPLAFLRVKWPARVPNREASYMLSEGQSQDGLTLDSLGVTNAIVTLKEGQLKRTVRLQIGTQS